MALPPTSSFGLSSESLEQSGKPMANTNAKALAPLPLQSPNSSQGPMAILWDIENCPVPSDVRPEDVASNIRMTLRVHPVIKGAVTVFSAYGDFNAFPRRLREGCQRTGVKLIDVPNGRKDAADKAILVDMFLFALDNPPPSSIMLISGDVDFAPALHILGQRGYTVILVIPARVDVSSALCNAGRFVWDWPSVARGEGFVPPAKALIPCRGGVSDFAGILMGCCQINDNLDGQHEDEAIMYRGLSQSYYNAREFSMISHSLAEYNTTSISMPCYPTGMRTHSLPSGLNEVSAEGPSSHDQSDLTWVQPGDINGLKGQLVKLLELSGGCLPLTRVHAEYQKIYGRPLYVLEYGAAKLVKLLKKMSDAISVEGTGQKKIAYLHNSCAVPSAPPLTILKRDNKGKGTQEGNADIVTGAGSSDEFSDDERGLTKEHGGRCEKSDMGAIVEKSLENFKYELQEILVSYSCRIFLGCFEAIYQQRYKRQLDYESFGVDELEQLLAKVKDVAIVQEEPVSKRKFLAAVGA